MSSIFTEEEKRWYKRDVFGNYILDENGRRIKIIPNNIELNSFIVAIWYLDDGTHSPKKRVCSFATNGFTVDENLFLIEKLNNLSINAYFNKKKREVAINTKSYLFLINLILPHVNTINCMQYKVDLSNYKAPIKNKISEDLINQAVYFNNTTNMSMIEIGELLGIGGQNVSQICRRNRNEKLKSEVKGVLWRGDFNKWTVVIYGVDNRKQIHIGSFNDKEIAEKIALEGQFLKEQGVKSLDVYKALANI